MPKLGRDRMPSAEIWLDEITDIERERPDDPELSRRVETLLTDIDGSIGAIRDMGDDDLARVGYVLHLASFLSMTRILPPTDLDGIGGALDALVLAAARIYRRIPSPDKAPYGLLSVRSEALAYSKRDTVESYLDSRLAFEDARQRISRYLFDHPNDERIRTQLLEVNEQIDLAECGTSARIAEQRLVAGSTSPDGTGVAAGTRSGSWRRLCDGIRHAESAIASLERLTTRQPERAASDWRSLGIGSPSWRFRPYSMAARCHLNAVPFCWLFSRGASVVPQFGINTWPEAVRHHRDQTRVFFASILETARHPGFNLTAGETREIAQIRLHFGLLFPGDALPSDLDEAALAGDVPDVAALSAFLCHRKEDANVIASITDDVIVDVIEDHRSGYKQWLDRWCCLARRNSRRRLACTRGCSDRHRQPYSGSS